MCTEKSVGIPKALGYYYFYPLWCAFFTHLGVNVKMSSATNRRILEAGCSIVPSEACLPLKCYVGHVLSLINQVDLIFVPRLVCLEKNPRVKLGCPKLIGLPDMIRALIPRANLLSLDVDCRIEPEAKTYTKLAHALGYTTAEGKRAYEYAKEEFKRVAASEKSLPAANAGKDTMTKIGVLGHAYILHDNYLNMNVWTKLSDLGCQAIDCHHLSDGDIENGLKHIKPVTWYFEDRLLGAAVTFRDMDAVSGIVYLVSFGCGAGSITNEIIELEILQHSSLPFLRIILDEYSGETGLMTRLESFVDMVQLKAQALL
jgi:predicted nucleotide-binding protein (sugar kinase/HSP70/actin superfamily)